MSREYISSLKVVCLSLVDPRESLLEINDIDMIGAKEQQMKMKIRQILLTPADSLVFDKAAEKICMALKVQNKDMIGLCKSPLNNSSWIYFVHYLLNLKEPQNLE